MRITWVSGDKALQQVQYGDGKMQTSGVTTFSQDDMISELLSFSFPTYMIDSLRAIGLFLFCSFRFLRDPKIYSVTTIGIVYHIPLMVKLSCN